MRRCGAKHLSLAGPSPTRLRHLQELRGTAKVRYAFRPTAKGGLYSVRFDWSDRHRLRGTCLENSSEQLLKIRRDNVLEGTV